MRNLETGLGYANTDPSRHFTVAAPLTDGIAMCDRCGSLDAIHDCTLVLLSRARWLILHYAHLFNDVDKQEALPLVEQIAVILTKRAARPR